jgi:RNA polymerase sigma factor (sigma-70 family)
MGQNQDAIIKTIPHLRRYARILTGSQEIGDAWVEQCLNQYMETPGNGNLEAGGNLKFALFRVLHQVGQELASQNESDMAASGFKERLREAVDSLPPVSRQLLLLVVIEDFTAEEAAEILGLSVETARETLKNARADLRYATSVPILIIEDEPLIAMDLAQTVEEMGYTVSATANREARAIAAAEKSPPALILADIQLLEGDSGINAVQHILNKFDVPVIFVTGYPERLLAGHTPEPTEVVAKPSEPETVKVTSEQARGHNGASAARTVHYRHDGENKSAGHKYLTPLRHLTPAISPMPSWLPHGQSREITKQQSFDQCLDGIFCRCPTLSFRRP